MELILRNQELGEYYFNINDLSIMVDIVLREIQTNLMSDTRVSIFKLLLAIVENKIYQEQFYKMDEIHAIINELIQDAEDGVESQNENETMFVNQIFEYINKFK